jgi:hypothetical protein
LDLCSWQKITTWIKLNKMNLSLKLLVIDDDEPVLANLCYFLRDKKYEVIIRDFIIDFILLIFFMGCIILSF